MRNIFDIIAISGEEEINFKAEIEYLEKMKKFYTESERSYCFLIDSTYETKKHLLDIFSLVKDVN